MSARCKSRYHHVYLSRVQIMQRDVRTSRRGLRESGRDCIENVRRTHPGQEYPLHGFTLFQRPWCQTDVSSEPVWFCVLSAELIGRTHERPGGGAG
jgi:hypothetical protein